MNYLFLRTICLFPGVFCFLLFLPFLYSDDLQITLDIDGLDETLDIESVEWGVVNNNLDVSPAEFDDLGFASILSKSSPELFQRTASGDHFTAANLSFYEDGQGEPFYEIELGTVYVSSASIETSGDGVHQEISLRYDTIQWTYYIFDGKDKSAGWNIQSNTPY